MFDNALRRSSDIINYRSRMQCIILDNVRKLSYRFPMLVGVFLHAFVENEHSRTIEHTCMQARMYQN